MGTTTTTTTTTVGEEKWLVRSEEIRITIINIMIPKQQGSTAQIKNKKMMYVGTNHLQMH